MARLTLAVPPSRRTELLEAYDRTLAPLLEAHGLAAVAGPEMLTDSSSSWRFEFASTQDFVERRREMVADGRLQAVMRDLEQRFGSSHPPSLILVSAPMPPGRVTPAGPGHRVRAGGGSRKGVWHILGVADGLPDPAVICVFQDRQGNLWLGTDGGGVSRYDGEEIITWTTDDGLVHNIVSSIVQDRDGALWFGTGTYRSKFRGGGLSRFDGHTFANWTAADGLGDNTVLALTEAGDGLWISTMTGGAMRYDGERLTGVDWADGLPGEYVLSMAVAADGTLWLGTSGGLSRRDGARFTHLPAIDDRVSNTIWALLPAGDGEVWVGTPRGVGHWDGHTLTPLVGSDGLGQDQVTSILLDRSGDLWFGTLTRGVTRWDGTTFTRYGTDDGLAHWRVLSMLEDRDGDLWFGGGGGDASGNGVTRYTGDELITFTTAHGLPADEVMCLAEDRQGRLWVGTWAGAAWFDGQRFRPLKGVTSNVRAILEDRSGRIWFATLDGVVRREVDGELTHFSTEDGLTQDWVESLAEDATGNLWFGTYRGVSRYDGASFRTYTTADGLGGIGVEAILADADGTVWFGTDGTSGRAGEGALTRLSASGWTTWTSAQGLPGSRVSALARDRDGNLWAGTEGGGVSRLDGDTFTRFTTADGLGNNKAVHILCDRDGQLWFATYGGGVSRFDGTDFQTLLERDGLAHDATQQVLQDRQGDFWIATEGGLTRYRPRRVVPAVSVTAVTTERDHDPAERVEMSSSPGRVSFEFLGGSFRTRPDQMLYRYRLTGYQQMWRTTRHRRVAFDHLPPGDYTFQVRAVDRDLNASESASVQVHVYRAYERIAWFAVLVTAVMLVLWQTVRVVRRDRRLHETNAALAVANRNVEEATRRKSEFLARMSHDLRTPMNAIIGYTGILLRRCRSVLDERQYRNLENIQVSADHLLALINDILDLSKVEAGRIEIVPKPVVVSHLIDECISAVSSLAKPGVGLVKHVADVPPLCTDADRLRRVLMNLLSNSLKFTDEGCITVSLCADGQWQELAVADTGVGIPESDLSTVFDEFRQVGARRAGAPEGTGLGLAIAKRSVELLGGTIDVESQVGKGTQFTVRLRDVKST
ncbi:MAG: hypothetical protein HN712_20845 [Gemmatimonadetes bacterium]|nr:hypothetical protein [Gemmatimonadota bacterium]